MRYDFLATALNAAYHLAADLREKVRDSGSEGHHPSYVEAAVLLHEDETLTVEPFVLSEMDRVVAVVRYYRSALITSEAPL